MRWYIATVLPIIGVIAFVILSMADVYHTEKIGTSVISPKTLQKGGNSFTIRIGNLTSKQIETLRFAKDVAIKDGSPHPEAFQALLMQETHACDYVKGFRVAGQEKGLRPTKRYYGCGQVKLSAAWDVLKRYPELHKYSERGKFTTTDELIAHLVLNDEFNIRVASKYFLMVGGKKASLKRKITAYNQGLTGSYKVDINKWHYTVAVSRHMKGIVKDVNDYFREDSSPIKLAKNAP